MKTLTLTKETIRTLSSNELDGVQGGKHHRLSSVHPNPPLSSVRPDQPLSSAREPQQAPVSSAKPSWV